MQNKLSCAIVRDLLPSYADGLANDETNAAVNRHLAGCKDCSEALRLMNAPEPITKTAVKEIDSLKKVRKHSLRNALLIGSALILMSLFLFAFRFFYIGSRAVASDIVFDVAVEGSRVELTAHTLSSGLGISRITFSGSNGVVQVKVYTVPAVFFHSGDGTAFYDSSRPVERVQMDDLILWEDGVAISHSAAKLFAAKNPYVGDMSANANIAAILGISNHFGSFTNELQTLAQPYGWALILDEKTAIANESITQDKMMVDSCVLLATIDNLGYVTWRYPTTGSDMQEFTVTAEEASAFSGYDIKSYGDTVVEFQDFLQTLGIK